MTRITLTAGLGLALGPLLAGCSARALPESPPSSAASPSAAAGQLHDVTLSLREDPPLPGEKRPGWIGLDDDPPAEDPHAHHRHPAPAPADAGAPEHHNHGH